MLLLSGIFSNAQVVCVYCFDQNDSISQSVNNLLMNGSFENHTCIPNSSTASCCPNSNYYSGNISNWTCTGGGTLTYINIVDAAFSTIPNGNYGVYFGNAMCNACSSAQFDTTCLVQNSCIVAGIPSGFPSNAFPNYGGSVGVSLEQTVTGLIPGQAYVLEFWAGGEGDSTTFFFLDNGIFAVDVGFGNIFLKCKPTMPFPIRVGTRFIIEFFAASTSHTIKFTNWGHMCDHCTELILDDVRLYTIAELSPSVPACSNLPTSDYYSDPNICPGTCCDFTNLSLNSTSYQWYFPGATPDTSTAINPTNICFANPGTYDVTLIASNANGSDTLTLQNYITVYPFPSPQSITQNGDTLFALNGSTTYQWFFNTNIIFGATNYFYVATQSGDYNVVATDSNGCEVEAVMNNVVAAAAGGSMPSMMVYPNPVEDKFTIQKLQACPSCVAGRVTRGTASMISIYNVIGEKIFTSESSGDELIVDCRKFQAGIYFVEIFSGEKSYRTKFVKQ